MTSLQLAILRVLAHGRLVPLEAVRGDLLADMMVRRLPTPEEFEKNLRAHEKLGLVLSTWDEVFGTRWRLTGEGRAILKEAGL